MLLACRYCHKCPPNVAGIEARFATEGIKTGKYILLHRESPTGLEKGFCLYQFWGKASTSGEFHREFKDDEGNVTSSEDWNWDVMWTATYDTLIVTGSGSGHTSMGDLSESYTLLGSGSESGLYWLGDNDEIGHFGNLPGRGFGRPLEGYYKGVPWMLSDQKSYSFFRDLAIARLDNVTDKEWEYSDPSIRIRNAFSLQARLRAQFPSWKGEFGSGIRFAYRIALAVVNDNCPHDNEKEPDVEHKWITEDKETETIQITDGGTEIYSEVIDGIPEASELSLESAVQSKTLTITGPSRKLLPVLNIRRYYANSIRIPAFQAYDGSGNYYARETAAGAVNASQAAEGGWGMGITGIDILMTYGARPSGPARDYDEGTAYVPPSGAASATSHTVMVGEDSVTFSLSGPISPNEAINRAIGQIDALMEEDEDGPVYNPIGETIGPHVVATRIVGRARLTAHELRGKYIITIDRPTLPLDGAGTVTAKWKIHTITADGEKSVDDHSESHTWRSRDDEDPDSPEPSTKTFGPYTVTANEGELKWIEVLEPEEAQHVWPNPIWYVADDKS